MCDYVLQESGDDEYSSEESDADSSSDSDIDAPEDDEPISGSDDDGTKRKRRVITKSYKVRFLWGQVRSCRSAADLPEFPFL